MLHVGDIVRATIVELKPYGMYLRKNSDQIIVLLPDVAWEPIRDLEQTYKQGEAISVKIIEFVKARNLYKGSIRQLSPEKNPYSQLVASASRLMTGVVKGKYAHEVTVALSNDAWGHMSIDEVHEWLDVGDEILVKVQSVDPAQGKLKLTFAGRKQ